jgi:hypothetical protein
MPGKHSETMGKDQVKINFLATESIKVTFSEKRLQRFRPLALPSPSTNGEIGGRKADRPSSNGVFAANSSLHFRNRPVE